MLRKINPRALRIAIIMMTSIISFKIAAIVSNADTLPGVEYRACQTQSGWTKWVRNSVTCGDIQANNKIEAFKIILTDTTEADVRYKAYVAGKGWSKLESNGVTIGATEGIQAIKIALDGELESKYSIVYRVHMLGGDWSGWVKGPEIAGDVSGTTSIDGMEVVLVDKDGRKVISNAADYDEALPVAQGSETATVQQTEVVRNGETSQNTTTQEIATTTEAEVVTSPSQEVQSNTTQNADTVQVTDNTTQNADAVQVTDNTTQNADAVQVTDNITQNADAVQVTDNTTQDADAVQVTDNVTQTNDDSKVWADKLVRVAKEEIGYKQNSDGTTKYSTWWANKVSDNVFATAKWSSMFLAWCGNQAGLSDEQYGYYACSEYWKNWFINNSSYHTTDGYTPKVGDMVFMNNDSDVEADHNGLVIESTGTEVVCIEGNMDGEVKQTRYALTDSSLIGYGTPLYSKASNGTGSTGTNNYGINPLVSTGQTNEGTTPSNTTTQTNPTTTIPTQAANPTTNLERLSTPIEGIDVSTFNTINSWSSIASSTKFAYIRLGGRDTTGKLFTDSKYQKNISEANATGMDVGVYFFSQAITTQEAIEEAEYVIEKVKNYNIKYPIAIDSEKSPSGTRTDSLSKAKRTEIIITFMDKIAAAGYKAQVYSGKCYFYEKFDMDKLSGRDIWVAHYYKTYSADKITDFKYPFSIWQYTDRGSVNGVSGRVDKNICYVKY